jgi:hypothetical protein
MNDDNDEDGEVAHDDSPELNAESLWEISADDRTAVVALASFFESLVAGKVRAEILRSLSHVLLFLRRLPQKTEAVDCVLTFSLGFGDEMSFAECELDANGLRLGTGGSVYDPMVGGDSFSGTCYELTPEGDREGSDCEVYEWIGCAKSLLAMGGRLAVEDYSTDEIEWDESDTDRLWGMLDR